MMQFITVSGKTAIDTVKENKFGQMDLNMKDTGKTTKPTAKVD